MRKIIIAVSLCTCLAGAGAVWLFYRIFMAVNTLDETAYIYVYPGDNYDSLISYIEMSGVVINMNSFKMAARYEKLAGSVRPGRYKIGAGMNNKLLARTFKLGWQTPLNLTISGNIRDMSKLASVLSTKLLYDSTSIHTALTDRNVIDSIGFDVYSFPAMFLLNTYEVFWTITPEELIKLFKREYDTFWNEKRIQMAESIDISPVEISTLASIVAEETNLASEYPIIAGIYINRLKAGMPLQADPTIKFAHNDHSIKRILYKHLDIDSPYNTYKYGGIPPGPIVLPSPNIIDSVLNYNRHNYLYFCAKPSLDGSHNFAVTLAEHNRNARAYHAAISRL